MRSGSYAGFMGSPIEEAALALSRARRVVVLTGAGISAESGLRTFRDTMEGLWKSFDPQKLATPEAFAADPETVTRWYDHRRVGCLAAEPNAGHAALAELERRVTRRSGDAGGGAGGGRFTLLTQNVDRLHQRAGSVNVVELHGSIIEWRCTKTGEKITPGPEAMTEFPPRSPCGALLRPDVVWFGEMLPERAVHAAQEAVGSCEVFLSIGTSAQVYPAAGFIHQAARNGAKTIEVNKDPTPISRMVDWALHGRAGDVLPEVVRLMN